MDNCCELYAKWRRVARELHSRIKIVDGKIPNDAKIIMAEYKALFIKMMLNGCKPEGCDG